MLIGRVANSVPKFERRKKPCVLNGFRHIVSPKCFNKCGKNSQLVENMGKAASRYR